MAAVECPGCGVVQAAADRVCGNCGAELGPPPRRARIGAADIEPTEPEPADLPAAPSPPVESSPVPERDCRYCGKHYEPHESTCGHCGVDQPGAPMKALIELGPAGRSGGTEGSLPAHEGDVIRLGRGSANVARIVSLLNPYDYISRAHATVRILRHKIEVIDTSRNGTWVGADRLPANEPKVFVLPAELLLAQDYRVHIKVVP